MRHIAGRILMAGLPLIGADAAPQEQRPPAATPPKSLSVVGTIRSYDSNSRALVVDTPHGQTRFVLALDVRIHQGARTLPASNLTARHGQTVKVRYIRERGRLIARTVTIASSAPALGTKPPSTG